MSFLNTELKPLWSQSLPNRETELTTLKALDTYCCKRLIQNREWRPDALV